MSAIDIHIGNDVQCFYDATRNCLHSSTRPYFVQTTKAQRGFKKSSTKKALVSITIEFGAHSFTAGVHTSQTFLLIVNATTLTNEDMEEPKNISLAAYRADS